MSYDNTNSGFIGKNNRKRDDKDPDLSGSVNVEGVEYWLVGWKNAKGYGLRLKPKEAKPAQPTKPAQNRSDSFDDGIPF